MPIITGAHHILYSNNPEADRAFLRDVLKLPHVDVGGGWLILGLPPAEIAVHPSERGGEQQFWFMCDDLEAFLAELKTLNVSYEPINEQRYGKLSHFTLPSGMKLGIYQPFHPRPPAMS